MREELVLAFKAHVAALEFTEDSIELDRRLGEISTLLYDIRQEIDDEWRASRQRSRQRPKRSERIPEFNISDAELESILVKLKGQP